MLMQEHCYKKDMNCVGCFFNRHMEEENGMRYFFLSTKKGVQGDA